MTSLKIRDILDDAEQRGVAPGVAADGAGIGAVEIAADCAGMDVLARCRQRRRERLQQRLAPLEQEERRPPRRTRPKPRQLGEILDEAVDFGH